MPKDVCILHAVRDILFREWDPIGVNGYDQCVDEYDSYAPTICRYLLDGVDEYKLAMHLSELARVSMGLSWVDEGLNSKVARRLLSLLDTCKTRRINDVE
jgi:hypothetical protein